MDRTEIARLDTAVTLETPEGIEMELRPAGLFARGLAFLVDEVIRWVINGVTVLITAFAGLFGIGLAMIVVFLCYWLYGVAFEVFNNGVTPGKKLQGLQVVHDDGTPIRLPASMLRNLLLVVDLLPAAYAAGIVSMAVTSRFRRLGDLAAGTMVIYRREEERVPSEIVQGARTPPFPLSAAEQGAFVDFLERGASLTDERRMELAAILSKALRCQPADAMLEVQRIANGLRGGA